ncbi:MAG: aminoacyl-tRNA deacylase [Myxococcales bacterium]|nr:aminoacyl-tRNA deacylase [Myxococcales bacterium]MCB9753359.1 aminoacyl-tRNA deacylase [Myxococcales bacterium]
MARRPKIPSTPALRMLTARGVEFTLHPYEYVEHGGSAASSAALGVDEHHVVKTLIFEDAEQQPLIVLMHGDRSVSAKQLARVLGTRSTRPCAPATAERHSGYRVGGTSPFGVRRRMPVYVERSVLALPRVWINGGARGLLVSLAPAVLTELLAATPVEVAR